jgi:hypothetical protein
LKTFLRRKIMGRKQMLEEEHKRSQEGNSGKYNWANARELERLGIPEFRAEGGDNYIRVITPKFSKFDPDGENYPPFWKEVWIHSDVGADGRTFVCSRKMWGEPCAVCDYAETIRQKDPESELLKALWPGRRYMFFVYNVKDQETEKLGLHWYDAPKGVKEGIVAISRNKRSGQFIDVSTYEEGQDIEFEKTGSGMKTKYGGYALNNDNGQAPAEWYENVPDDFDQFILVPEYEAVASELGVAKARSRSEAPADEAPARGRSRSEAPADEAPARGRSRSEAPADEAPARGRSRSEAPADEAPAEEGRSRGSSRGGSGGIDPEVQNRIDALKNRGGGA